jgi:hypothetical protein
MLEPCLGHRAETLEVKLAITARYNDEYYDPDYNVRNVIARDKTGAAVPFFDPQSGTEVLATEFDWNTALGQVVQVIADQYPTEGWLEDGKFYPVPSSDDDSEQPDPVLSGFTISLDGKLLRADETDASAETEEVGY